MGRAGGEHTVEMGKVRATCNGLQRTGLKVDIRVKDGLLKEVASELGLHVE